MRHLQIYWRTLMMAASITLITAPIGMTQEGEMEGNGDYSNGATETDPAAAAIEAAARLQEAVTAIDPAAELSANGAVFTVANVSVRLIYDTNADRMRLVSGVANIDDIKTADLLRMMQANFDSALDSRYAVAQGIVWSTFIHPLSSLTPDDFTSGIAQTVNLVHTYGTTYSSGAFLFGGGDTAETQDNAEEEATEDKDRGIQVSGFQIYLEHSSLAP